MCPRQHKLYITNVLIYNMRALRVMLRVCIYQNIYYKYIYKFNI